MKNSADLGGCYPPRPSASVDNTLLDLQNSSYPNSIIAKYLHVLKKNFQHEKIISVSPSDRVILFLWYKIFTIRSYVTAFVAIFPRFSKVCPRARRSFWTFSEHCRRRPKKIRRYFDYTPTNLRVVKENKDYCCCYQI